eukprot:11196916-Lingulodinium_polyedra.AAC.1
MRFQVLNVLLLQAPAGALKTPCVCAPAQLKKCVPRVSQNSFSCTPVCLGPLRPTARAPCPAAAR